MVAMIPALLHYENYDNNIVFLLIYELVVVYDTIYSSWPVCKPCFIIIWYSVSIHITYSLIKMHFVLLEITEFIPVIERLSSINTYN